MPFSSVVPREWVQRYGAKFSDHALGTGPFVLQSWVHGSRMVLARHVRSGLPHLDKVVIDFNVPDHTQIQRVQAPDIAVNYLPFKGNLALRRAITMAINKRHILRLLNGRGVIMNGVLPPTMAGSDPHSSHITPTTPPGPRRCCARRATGQDSLPSR